MWLAWTEDPDDELAAELRKHKQKALDGIVAAAKLADDGKTPAAQRTARQLDALLNFQGDLGAAGTKTTAKALEWVKGRRPQLKYLRPGEQLFDLPGLPGLRVYVLGPPHDRRLIKRSDPEQEASRGLRAGRRRGLARGIPGRRGGAGRRRNARDAAVRRVLPHRRGGRTRARTGS